MTDREQQIKEMTTLFRYRCGQVPTEECALRDCSTCYATALYEAGYRKQSEWISVDDRLPEEDTRALVYLDIPKLTALTYTHCDTDRTFYGKWVRWGGYVTHWMPLPEPPKGETR